MLKIDEAIYNTDKVICKNIAVFDASERGLLSQNILAQLRNFIEYIVQKVHSNGNDTDPNNYPQKKEAWEYIKTKGNLKFLNKFHNFLQSSASHYTFDENGSERLMLKYYEYLLKIKTFLKNQYNMEVLENIEDFPLNTDTNLMEYYKLIVSRINSPNRDTIRNTFDDRSYIQKVKPFFVNNQIYYEITFILANDKSSKFDRVIAFTDLDILENYSVKLTIRNDYIKVMGNVMPIKIIEHWEVSIRPCELIKFANVFGNNPTIVSSLNEYRNIMHFMTKTQMSLLEIITLSNSNYNTIKKECSNGVKASYIFTALDQSREIIINNLPGSNILRYFLHNMNNNIMKQQLSRNSCIKLSNLYLNWGCIPFDEMPFASSLIKHNPKIYDLLECIDVTDKKHEFLARTIRTNAEQKGLLFTSISELNSFEQIDALKERYNSLIYPAHKSRYLDIFKNNLYIKGYVDDTANIIMRLQELSSSGLKGYNAFVESWLIKNRSYKIDSKEKLDALKTMFTSSRVALIYGSAGTGKSTLMNHVSNLYNDKNKLYLANTNPAVDNMRRKINSSNCTFKTIKKFLSDYNQDTEYDIVFIDECSTVSNKDMIEFLKKGTFKLLVLVGDTFQIESILFGNWFSIACKFVHKNSIFELSKPYRSNKDELKLIWDRVRKLDDSILELLVKYNYTTDLNESIFESHSDDEIILCLNYDGLYGINNLNRLLQSRNPNPSVIWGVNEYKINDPILFNENERFAPLIYNNMKGRIIDIEKSKDTIRFCIELDTALTEWDAEKYDFTLLDNSVAGNSIISFSVERLSTTDEDNFSNKNIVPFQIAYAISIHKAQGLEFNSVKIVISNEVEELITHNIFYTAITRAKEKLKIYWTPETEKKVLKNLSLKNYNKDAALLSLLKNLNK